MQSANAYYLQWANSIPGNTDLYPHDNVTDASGNVYNTGRYRGTVDFDPSAGVASYTANGFTDAFIQKLDPSGNLLWVINLTGGSWEQIMGLTMDLSGNLYAFGYFSGTVDFDPGPGVVSLTSAGGNDVVIMKLTPSGNLIWAKSFGAATSEDGLYVGCDLAGNIYCSGTFYSTVDFDPGPGAYTLAAVGNIDVYIAKFDPSGNFVWARSFGTSGADYLDGMDVNGSGDVIVTGTFSGSGDFNPNAGVSTLTAISFTDIFLVKLNASGTHVWSSSIGGSGYDNSTDACFTYSGDILISGAFNGAIDVDPGPGVQTLTPTGFDGYVLKLSAAGNFIWVRQFNGYSIVPIRMEVNASDKIIIIGSYIGAVDLDPGPGLISVTSGNTTQDSFVMGLDNTGLYEWHIDPEGVISFDQMFAITISSTDDIFILGRFTTGTIDLLPGPGVMSVTNSAPGSGNGFFFKLNGGGSLPVAASPLKGMLENGYARLKWSTFVEWDNEGFIIERSVDGKLWEEIGFITGKGNSNTVEQYSFLDPVFLETTSYYRYLQRDFNGKLTASAVVAVRPGASHENGLPFLFPNPGNGNVQLMNVDATEINALYLIHDHQGKLVSSGNLSDKMEEGHFSVPGSPGLYFISLYTGDKTYCIDYLKQ